MAPKQDLMNWLIELEDAFVTGQLASLYRVNPYLKPCWELLNCKKKRCPAYGHRKIRCWQVTGTFCDGSMVRQGPAAKWKDCRDCQVFRQATTTVKERTTELINNIVFSIEAADSKLLVVKRLIRRVLPDFAQSLGLTTREKEVLSLLLEGLSRQQTAKAMHISAETVKMHVKHLYKKTGVSSRQALYDKVVRYAKQRESRKRREK